MVGFVGNIEGKTLSNTFFRQVLFTAPHSQLVVMCLLPSEDIGVETHPNVDQFFRVEEGEGKVILNGEEYPIKNADAIVVPAGTEHNVINASAEKPLKLYTIYSPPNHPDGKIHQTKAEALADETDHL